MGVADVLLVVRRRLLQFLWQADSREQILEAGDRAAVLTAVYGKEAADKMLADWQGCLAGSETADAAPRRDFTDLDSSVGWLGLSDISRR
jgi:hypothetical protein